MSKEKSSDQEILELWNQGFSKKRIVDKLRVSKTKVISVVGSERLPSTIKKQPENGAISDQLIEKILKHRRPKITPRRSAILLEIELNDVYSVLESHPDQTDISNRDDRKEEISSEIQQSIIKQYTEEGLSIHYISVIEKISKSTIKAVLRTNQILINGRGGGTRRRSLE